MFSDLTWKKKFLFKEIEGGWRTHTPTPLLRPKTAVYTLIYGLRNSTFNYSKQHVLLLRKDDPLDETHLVVVRGLIHQEV